MTWHFCITHFFTPYSSPCLFASAAAFFLSQKFFRSLLYHSNLLYLRTQPFLPLLTYTFCTALLHTHFASRDRLVNPGRLRQFLTEQLSIPHPTSRTVIGVMTTITFAASTCLWETVTCDNTEKLHSHRAGAGLRGAWHGWLAGGGREGGGACTRLPCPSPCLPACLPPQLFLFARSCTCLPTYRL